MKKKILCLLGLMILINQVGISASAKGSAVNSKMKVAIKKYKSGNYTGCLQDCQNIVKSAPNGLAYYYMAMSYTKAGKKTEAVNCYSKVLSLSKTPQLREYAAQGKRCLETPELCHPAPMQGQVDENELDKFINANSSDLSSSVKNDYQQKRLRNIMNEINNGKDLDDYNFKNFKEYNNRSQGEACEKIAYTDAEIQQALNVLNNSGYNTANMPKAMPQNQMSPEMLQIQAMLGSSSNNVSGGNSMVDMLPYMVSQQKDGSSTYSPQMMQSIILNSTMMNEFNYNLQDNR